MSVAKLGGGGGGGGSWAKKYNNYWKCQRIIQYSRKATHCFSHTWKSGWQLGELNLTIWLLPLSHSLILSLVCCCMAKRSSSVDDPMWAEIFLTSTGFSPAKKKEFGRKKIIIYSFILSVFLFFIHSLYLFIKFYFYYYYYIFFFLGGGG